MNVRKALELLKRIASGSEPYTAKYLARDIIALLEEPPAAGDESKPAPGWVATYTSWSGTLQGYIRGKHTAATIPETWTKYHAERPAPTPRITEISACRVLLTLADADDVPAWCRELAKNTLAGACPPSAEAPTPPLGSLERLAASWEREAQELREEASRYMEHTAERLREEASVIDNRARELREALAALPTPGLPALPSGWKAEQPYGDGYDTYFTYTRIDTDKSIHDITVWSHPLHAITVYGDIPAQQAFAVLAHHMARVSAGDGAT